MIDMSDSRRKREARLRRCLEETSVAQKQAARPPQNAEAFISSTVVTTTVASNRVSQQDALLPKAQVSRPERLLRSFFPENWLFSLEMVEGDEQWERCF